MSDCEIPLVDLFAGAGGLSLGLSAAGMTPVAASEWDVDALSTYVASHQVRLPANALSVLEGDIAQHSFRKLRGEVAVVAGGPPCQPFSLGGARLGINDPRNGLPQFVRAVAEIRPEAFLLENVPGLARGGQARVLHAMVEELRQLGYFVEWRVLHAADFGVAQRRQRLFVFGSRRPGFAWPQASHGPSAHRPWRAAHEILDPDAPLGQPNLAKVTYARSPDLRPSPWDGHLWNGGGRPINPNGLVPTLLASMGGNKTPWLDGDNVVPGYHSELVNGGSARSGAVPGARRLTVGEAALVQGFPLDMPWFGRTSSRYRQIGYAVPVPLAAAVGLAVVEHVSSAASTSRHVAAVSA